MGYERIMPYFFVPNVPTMKGTRIQLFSGGHNPGPGPLPGARELGVYVQPRRPVQPTGLARRRHAFRGQSIELI